MTRKYWLNLVPDLLLSVGIILSTLISVLTVNSAWFVMAGPAVLALILLCADMLSRRLQGRLLRAAPASLIMASSLLVAALIVATRNPTFVATLIPIMGASSWVILKSDLYGRAKTCRT